MIDIDLNADNETIVAEVSTTWPRTDNAATRKHLLAYRFEMIVQVNKERGYALHDWRFSQVVVPELPGEWSAQLVETIIAIFKKEK